MPNKWIMNNYISISQLNDFIFCPYSIYLHNVYMEADEDIFKAPPQKIGKLAHNSIDSKKYSTKKSDIMSLPVYSEELGIVGVIDIFREDTKILIERKYNLKNIFRGQTYQLWAQYFCMCEMGYDIRQIAFYEISSNKMIQIPLPNDNDKNELAEFIQKFRDYNPITTPLSINHNKCLHCIYCNLCDKTNIDNVYT